MLYDNDGGREHGRQVGQHHADGIQTTADAAIATTSKDEMAGVGRSALVFVIQFSSWRVAKW